MGMVKIAIDAMGGDYGPEPIVRGAVQALKARRFIPILVGDRKKILSLLPKGYKNNISIIDASDVPE
jgi:glycerol-3-phosphate acyltransferase PlsX